MTITQVARICHEANRALCAGLDDYSQVEWNDAPDWQVNSAIDSVKFVLANPEAPFSASHDNWYKLKESEGWVHGEVKDSEKKTHPCMVPYQELPKEQQVKDALFKSVVMAVKDLIVED